MNFIKWLVCSLSLNLRDCKNVCNEYTWQPSIMKYLRFTQYTGVECWVKACIVNWLYLIFRYKYIDQYFKLLLIQSKNSTVTCPRRYMPPPTTRADTTVPTMANTNIEPRLWKKLPWRQQSYTFIHLYNRKWAQCRHPELFQIGMQVLHIHVHVFCTISTTMLLIIEFKVRFVVCISIFLIAPKIHTILFTIQFFFM